MSKTSYYYLRPENRAQVSLRVPYEIALAIEEYSASRGLRKTDAYVHFLAKGLANSEGASASIEQKLDRVIALLEEMK